MIICFLYHCSYGVSPGLLWQTETCQGKNDKRTQNTHSPSGKHSDTTLSTIEEKKMKYRLLLHRVWATHPQCWHIKDILSTRGGIRPTPPLVNLVLHLRSKPLWSSSLEHCFYFSFIKSLRQEGQRESHKGHLASLSLFAGTHCGLHL